MDEMDIIYTPTATSFPLYTRIELGFFFFFLVEGEKGRKKRGVVGI
jgi:hypothetical protein